MEQENIPFNTRLSRKEKTDEKDCVLINRDYNSDYTAFKMQQSIITHLPCTSSGRGCVERFILEPWRVRGWGDEGRPPLKHLQPNPDSV